MVRSYDSYGRYFRLLSRKEDNAPYRSCYTSCRFNTIIFPGISAFLDIVNTPTNCLGTILRSWEEAEFQPFLQRPSSTFPFLLSFTIIIDQTIFVSSTRFLCIRNHSYLSSSCNIKRYLHSLINLLFHPCIVGSFSFVHCSVRVIVLNVIVEPMYCN